jgi:hypothetical protein
LKVLAIQFNLVRNDLVALGRSRPLKILCSRYVLPVSSRPESHYTPPEIPNRFGKLRRQWLAFHRPAERLCHCGIEVGDEALDPLLQMLLGGEVAAAKHFANRDREPDLDPG